MKLDLCPTCNTVHIMDLDLDEARTLWLLHCQFINALLRHAARHPSPHWERSGNHILVPLYVPTFTEWVDDTDTTFDI